MSAIGHAEDRDAAHTKSKSVLQVRRIMSKISKRKSEVAIGHIVIRFSCSCSFSRHSSTIDSKKGSFRNQSRINRVLESIPERVEFDPSV